MKYKKCACCHRILDETHFTKNLRNKDGLHSYCKECNKKKAQEFNRSKGPEYTRKYRVKQIEDGYYRYGHGAFANMKKSSSKRNIAFLMDEKELYDWWRNTNDKCFYCGVTIDEYIGIKNFIITYDGDNELINYIKQHVFNKDIYKKIETMTIDRVDSFGPYSLSNIVKSCWICNSLKSNTLSGKDMKEKGHKVLEIIKEEMGKYDKK